MLGLACYLRCSIVMLHCNNVVPGSPEVADVVFNRCVEKNDGSDYEITLNYEFLEDIYIYPDWPKKDECKGCCGKPGAEEAVQQLERKENHPLMIMVSPSSWTS